MLESPGLYLLKLVPRILIQTCCSLTSYTLVRVSTYRNNVKRMVGELQFSTVTEGQHGLEWGSAT